MGNPRRVSLRCEPQVCIPQAKLKEIIARLDARCNGGFRAGRIAAGPGGSDEDEDPQPWASKAGGGTSSGTAAAGMHHVGAPSRSPRRTVLLSATLHQDLGDLAAAILSDAVPVGFAVQSLVSEKGCGALLQRIKDDGGEATMVILK